MTLIVLMLLISNVFAGECEQAEKKSPFYQAIEACRETQAARETTDTVATLKATFNGQNYCQISDGIAPTGKSLSPRLCGDPVAHVCNLTNRSGNVFDSKCRMLDHNKTSNSPESLAIDCAVKQERSKFLTAHILECRKGVSEEDCVASLKVKYSKQLAKIERDLVYSKERIQSVQKSFDRVKSKLIELITTSDLVSQKHRKYLISIINRTEIALSEKYLGRAANSTCTNSDGNGSSRGAFIAFDDDGDFRNRIYICNGYMRDLENVNPVLTMNILAHELAHSIDPCGLETDVAERIDGDKSPGIGKGSPYISERIFPGLVECLRGGSGPHGCENSWVNCTTAAGKDEYCRELADSEALKWGWKETYKNCYAKTVSLPSCKWGSSDPDPDRRPANYSRSGAPLSQIDEAFSDFIASEVTGAIIKEDALDIKTTEDAFTSIVSAYARGGGVCIDRDKRDVHPAAYIRMNRLLLGSKIFRDAVGCKNMPKPERGGVSCKAFFKGETSTK